MDSGGCRPPVAGRIRNRSATTEPMNINTIAIVTARSEAFTRSVEPIAAPITISTTMPAAALNGSVRR